MREFIRLMRDSGEVIDVEEPVDIRFEAPKMASRTDKLLVFHNTGGMPAVMNVTASRKALSLALGIAENEIVKKLSGTDCGGRINGQGTISMATPDLSSIPVMTHFPKDAGPYITAGIIFSKFGDVENASIHRMLVLDRTHVAARLVEGRHTHSLMKKAQAEGKELPVAMAIGVHPAVTFASCSRVPWGDELSFAATLLGGEIGVRECPNGVLVPDAEIIFEGYISSERHAEGPFVDITGTYDIVRNEPVIRFTGMHIKKGALYHRDPARRERAQTPHGCTLRTKNLPGRRRCDGCKKCQPDTGGLRVLPRGHPDKEEYRRRREKCNYGSIRRPYVVKTRCGR